MRGEQAAKFIPDAYKPHEAREPQRLEEHSEIWRAFEGIKDDQEKLAFLQKARQDDSVNSLAPDEQQKVIRWAVKRYADLLEHGKSDDFHGAIETVHLFMPNIRNHKKADIIDAVMKMVPELYLEHPEAAKHLTNVLDQDAQVVRPEVYLETVGKILSQPGMSYDARQGALAGLSYHASFGLLPYLQERLQAIEHSTVEQGAILLTVLDATARYGSGWSFSEESSEEIERLLFEFADKTSSVLLRRKAEAILKMRQAYPMRAFAAEKKRLEKQYATADIKVEGIYRDRAIVMPVASDYLGIYSADGQARGLLKNKKLPFYGDSEIMHPGELPFMALREGLDAEEKERRMQVQRDYVMLLDKDVLEGIEKDYGISLRELTIREQMWFVAFLRDLKKEDEARVQKFTQGYGINGVRTFLSLEQGKEASDAMLIIGERFEPRVASEIFSKYSEIVKASETVRDYLQTQWGKSREYTQEKEDLIVEGLLKRGKDLLAQFSQETKRESGPRAAAQKIMSRLDKIRADILLFAGVFKLTANEHPFQFEEVKGLALQSLLAREIAENDKKEMKDILQLNWQAYSQQAQDEVLHGFEQSFATAGAKFYVLRKDDVMLGFVRFEPKPNGNLYAGSFNVRPEILGSAIGSAMAKAILDKESREHTIEVEVYERTRMLKHYVRDFGFEVTGEIMENGEKIFKLERKAASAARPEPVKQAA